jgi:hypothetical protein
MMFKVWYYKHFDYTKPVVQEWVPLFKIEAKSLDDVFMKMQGEIWSPMGEARALIRSLGLTHTSMSVGDFIEDEAGKFHRVMSCGFQQFDSLPVGEVISAKSFF